MLHKERVAARCLKVSILKTNNNWIKSGFSRYSQEAVFILTNRN